MRLRRSRRRWCDSVAPMPPLIILGIVIVGGLAIAASSKKSRRRRRRKPQVVKDIVYWRVVPVMAGAALHEAWVLYQDERGEYTQTKKIDTYFSKEGAIEGVQRTIVEQGDTPVKFTGAPDQPGF